MKKKVEFDDWPVPFINTYRCTGCGLCAKVCPKGVLAMVDNKVVIVNPALCHYSGDCERICPEQAITLEYQIISNNSHGETKMTYKRYPDWKEKVVFSPEGPDPQVLEETEKVKVIVAGLEPGQEIPDSIPLP